MGQKVVGLGAGGHAKVLIEILKSHRDVEIVGLLDPKQELYETAVLGVPVLGDDALLPTLEARGVQHFFIGLGSTEDSRARQQLFELAIEHGLAPVQVVHPQAIVSPSAILSPGVAVMAGAVINAEARIGINSIINTGAVVEHDCGVGDHVHIATGAKLASTVQIHDGAHVGLGATVRQCLTIGRDAVIGAGATVVKDVQPGTVVVGVPARMLRTTVSFENSEEKD